MAGAFGAQLGSGFAASMTLGTTRITTFSGAAPPDITAPQLTTLQMFDTNTNGKVDRVVATFNETLNAAYSAGIAGWTLANVPSAGTLASVTVAGTAATLTINEGGNAANTAVGTFTVALASTANGVRDAAGNRSSFAATAPADKAGPVPTSFVTLTAGATAGRMQQSDQLLVVFSEVLLATSVPATTNVTEADPAGAATIDTITVPSFMSGTRSTGSSAYITTDGATATAAASMALSFGNVAITLTLTNCTCGSAVTGTAAAFTYVGASSITDAAGNATAGSFTTAATFRFF
jgi:hypothetical protein